MYDRGNLYTGAGQVWTADTRHIIGKFGSTGIPVSFSDRGQMTYVEYSGVSLFDLATMRPLGTLPSAPISPTVPLTAAVRAGAGTIAFSTGGQIVLVPLASLQPWPKYPSNL